MLGDIAGAMGVPVPPVYLSLAVANATADGERVLVNPVWLREQMIAVCECPIARPHAAQAIPRRAGGILSAAFRTFSRPADRGGGSCHVEGLNRPRTSFSVIRVTAAPQITTAPIGRGASESAVHQ